MQEVYEVVFADKNIQFEILPAPQGAPAYGDRDLWLQAVSNLLDNAYKYTPAGGRVGMALSIEGPALHLRISDSGPGIPTSEHANVFKRFYRLDKHRSQKGTGLGLSLVAAVCKVHRAAIELGNSGGLMIDIRIPVDIHADEPAGVA
jgi:signal transduction histidine kinase